MKLRGAARWNWPFHQPVTEAGKAACGHPPARFANLITRINAPALVDEWGCEKCDAAYLGPRPDDGLCPECRASSQPAPAGHAATPL